MTSSDVGALEDVVSCDDRQFTRCEKCARATASMRWHRALAWAADLMLTSHMMLLRSREAAPATASSCAQRVRAGCVLGAHVLGSNGAQADTPWSAKFVSCRHACWACGQESTLTASTTAIAGSSCHNLHEDAATTVILYREQQAVKNFAFTKGAISERSIQPLLEGIEELIVPAKRQ